MRLVYADDVIEIVNDMDDRGLLTDILDVEEAVDEAPTVEAIPIVYIAGYCADLSNDEKEVFDKLIKKYWEDSDNLNAEQPFYEPIRINYN